MSNLRVAGEIEAFCNRCEMRLAHTIVAMVGPKVVRVKCNTCQTEHAYRDAQKTETGKTQPRVSKAAVDKVIFSFEEQLAQRTGAQRKKYAISTVFTLEDAVEHPTFGMGIVTAVRADKIDVQFKSFEKTLIHAKAAKA